MKRGAKAALADRQQKPCHAMTSCWPPPPSPVPTCLPLRSARNELGRCPTSLEHRRWTCMERWDLTAVTTMVQHGVVVGKVRSLRSMVREHQLVSWSNLHEHLFPSEVPVLGPPGHLRAGHRKEEQVRCASSPQPPLRFRSVRVTSVYVREWAGEAELACAPQCVITSVVAAEAREALSDQLLTG